MKGKVTIMKALEMLNTRKKNIREEVAYLCTRNCNFTRDEKRKLEELAGELAMVATAIEEIESLTKQLNEETEEHMKACRMCYEQEKTIAELQTALLLDSTKKTPESPERRILENLKPFLLQNGIVVDVNNPDTYFDAYEECRHDFGNLL